MANWAVKWLVILNLLGVGTFACAQNADMGASTYQAICAPCHGTDGKGNGPLREALKVAPPDLTTLAKKMAVCCPSALYTMLSMDEK